ncbi:hypothetical protein [Yoonia sp. I 8.24]|uniref:hypothetical protein n=1 Tax=Yoonia sp. I 8.24 TaxID=1537229 RepID=UPI001EDCEB1B|nr:hypothetical protein [Yoonia sp. I 8.24]MCG3266098.1 hypothetical protein [Yoonia sp. I 8.24]
MLRSHKRLYGENKMVAVYSLIYTLGWALFGPLITLAAVPFFVRRGPERPIKYNVPNLNLVIVISFAASLTASGIFYFWTPNRGVLEVAQTIASFQILPSSISSAVLSGSVTAIKPFLMIQTGGILSLVFGVMLYANPAHWANTVYDIFSQLERHPNGKPRIVALFSAAMVGLILFTQYLTTDDSAHLGKISIAFTLMPSLLFCSSCLCVIFTQKLTSSKEDKKGTQ